MYYVALFEPCSDGPSFFEMITRAPSPEDALKKAMDMVIKFSQIPKDALERDEPILVRVTDDNTDYNYIVYRTSNGEYEYDEYDPLITQYNYNVKGQVI